MCAAPFSWPENYRSAVSLSFDDARPSQVLHCAPVLDAYGIRGTFYVLPRSVEKDIPGWQGVQARGHEIGNHTSTHPCTGNFNFSRQNALENLSLEAITADILAANGKVADLLGVTPATFAYPCGNTYVGRGEGVQSYVPVIAREFVAGRGYPGEYHNDPAFCDMAQLQGRCMDNLDAEVLIGWVRQAQKEGGWLVLAAHDVGPEAGPQVVLEERLRRLCAFLHDPAEGIWVAPVVEVARHVVAHRPAGV